MFQPRDTVLFYIPGKEKPAQTPYVKYKSYLLINQHRDTFFLAELKHVHTGQWQEIATLHIECPPQSFEPHIISKTKMQS